MAALILLTAKLGLETRRKSQILNDLDRTASYPGIEIQIRDLKKKYPNAIHRDVGPSSIYNCHGLTFGSRRTWIEGSEIKKILREDDYIEVSFKDAMVGDIAIYYEDGEIEHSGIVVERKPAGPVILSKWARCHEVVHLYAECPYGLMVVKYYRIQE